MLHWLLLPSLDTHPRDNRSRHEMALEHERQRRDELRLLKKMRDNRRK